MELPFEFKEKMKFLLKDEYNEYLSIFDEKRYFGLRTNTLKITPQNLEKIVNFKLKPVKWCDEGFYYDEDERPAKNFYYYAGLYYLQEPSAMTPVSVFEINEGDRVLDICAAPGGKSTYIGQKLKNTGVLISNDISATRTKALLKNIELFGIKNAIVMSESPKKLKSKFNNYFDKILIDAPCSGEGMFRKEPNIIKNWNKDMIDFCCVQQADILDNASYMLCNDGYIMYSTCTFSIEENERTINNFLDSHKDFELCQIPMFEGFSEGFEYMGNKDLKKCVRLFPHKIKGEGHFLALLHKKGKKQKIDIFDKNSDDIRIKYFIEFKEKYLNLDISGIFKVFGDNLYLMPYDVPDLSKIRVLRSGWHLGIFKKSRFEPSQALAMGLKINEVKNFINIKDENIMRYLKGETIECENAKEGWILVCMDNFPLGWGKYQNGRIKNKYFIGWKWQ